MLRTRREVVPFNQIQGITSTNVCAYSNGGDHFFSVERNYYHGIFLGFKWECIEFARRWLLMSKSCIFPNILHAADIWNQLRTIERVTDGKQISLTLHFNGSYEKPKRDSLLIYPRSSALPFGHIAIICDVISDYIRVAEQNYEYYNWSDNYSRQIPLILKNNRYYIDDEHEVFGWMTIEDSENLEPLDETKLDLILKQYQQTNSIGTLERCIVPNKNSHLTFSWLNENDKAENLFMNLYGNDLIRTDTNTLPYYKANQDLLLNIGGVSNELHQMFLNATNYVLNNDDLLKKFCIPEIFWSKIRQSWLNEKYLTMTGRFDLAFNGKEIKVFEYNADSAAALFETSIIQEKWAQKLNFERTFMSGFQIHHILVKNWKKFSSIERVHILIDEDQEELLTAYYMQNILKDANIDSKICIMTNDLYWRDSKIIDNEGYNVELVWKLWMWETIFSNYIQCENEGNLNRKINGEHPYLCQIFLNDHIKIIEPLWKVIPSNKAILPILWLLYPNHPNLLRSEYVLTNDLKQVPFVKKPIVGRCGHNVTLYDVNGDSVIDETKGKFVDRNCIYQELFSLTNFDGYYPIIGSWIVHGLFGGFGIREDKKLITDADSPVTACCIVWK
ncbi:unnamed protein product [Rotaria sordida]|uniref:Peptidase C51 domain-containing protein n=1 Tax=Rotaria sordida TaxID=392033 RepID=A0A813XE93_9BILA|nr:unnamed protein product [Rotaria sordida]CAF0887608.1 unnamed protein product [Rotaria sordida]